MLDKIIAPVISVLSFIIVKFSYFGVIFLMAVESANIPVPSEAIMPYAGYIVSKGQMNFFLAALSGAIGCTLGSILSYYIGYYGGRTFLEKYGKYMLVSKHDIAIGDKLFQKYGDGIAFVSRLIPVVRTFISLPAGISRMNIKKFTIYSFLGSFIWSLVLTFVGVKIGDNKKVLQDFFHKFDIAIVVILLLAIILYIYSHLKKLKG